MKALIKEMPKPWPQPTGNSRSTVLAGDQSSHHIRADAGNQSSEQPRHRQAVIRTGQAQATSHHIRAGTGNQSSHQGGYRQPVITTAQAQAGSHQNRPGTSKQSAW